MRQSLKVTPEYWEQHVEEESFNFPNSRKRRAKKCGKVQSSGVKDKKIVDCSAYQACQRCGKRSSFGVAGTRKAEYCAQHAPDGMVNVRYKICRTEGRHKQVRFGEVYTKTSE